MRILIIEDYPDVAACIQDFAEEKFGADTCQFDYALNGNEASLKLCDNDYDLIFLDVHLPVMTGIEFYKLNKNHLVKTPVLFVTATPDYALEFVAHKTDVVAKPICFQTFSEALDKILTKPHVAAQII